MEEIMKSFVTRAVDRLGRIVLPIDLRKKHRIETGTALEVGEDDKGQIVLRRQALYCQICGSMDGLVEFAGKKCFICEGCKCGIQEMT